MSTQGHKFVSTIPKKMFPDQKVGSKDLNQRRALSTNGGKSLRYVHARHTPSNRQGDGKAYFRPASAAASRSSRKSEAASKTSTSPSSQPPPEDQVRRNEKKNASLNRHQRIGKHAAHEGNRNEYLHPHQNQASHNTSTNGTSTFRAPYSDETTTSRTNVRNGPILPPTPDKTAKRRWSVCDDLDGEQLDSIAKGMMSNERFPKQQKGVKIAGRRIGKVKRKRRTKENNTERSTSECRQRKTKKARSAHTSSKQGGNGEATSDLPSPQHQDHPEKKRHRRRRQRPLPQPPPEGQVRRNEKLHKLATNPCHLDPAMAHNKTVYEQFGGHITELTEPQVKIRKRRRSNSVKDPQMDFDH